MDPDGLRRLTGAVVDAAFQTRQDLGAGLYEHAYKRVLAHRLRERGLSVAMEVPVRLVLDGVDLDVAGRLDLLVEDTVVVEAKAVRELHPLHVAQTLTYLRLTGMPVALLINFNALPFRSGIRRLVQGDLARHGPFAADDLAEAGETLR